MGTTRVLTEGKLSRSGGPLLVPTWWREGEEEVEEEEEEEEEFLRGCLEEVERADL